MSYIKRYLEEVLQHLQDHPEDAKAGAVITITSDTPSGSKDFKHEVTESDLTYLADWISE